VTINTRQLAASTSVTYEVAVPGVLGDYVTGTSGNGRLRVRVTATSSSSFTSATDRLAVSFR
jgi:hypothetical protein